MNQEQIFREEIRSALSGVDFEKAAQIEALRKKVVLEPKEVSQLYHWSPSTLRDWRALGIGPKYIKDGRYISYRITDLDAYISSRTVKTRDQQ